MVEPYGVFLLADGLKFEELFFFLVVVPGADEGNNEDGHKDTEAFDPG